MNRSLLLVDDIYRWYADTIVYRLIGPLIALLGIVGGTLSCLVFRRKGLRKKSCSQYLFFLALADLLCMICWLVHFVFPSYNIHVMIYSNILCKTFVFGMYLAFNLANYILTACSIDRAVSVLFPLESRRYCRREMAYWILFLLLLIEIVFNSHLLYGFVVSKVNSTHNQSIWICHHRFDSLKYQQFFSAYDSYVDVIKTNVIPFILMSICNMIIISRVCQSSSREIRRKSRRKSSKDRQLTLMLLGSAFAFLILTLPTEINDIIRSYSQDKFVNEKTYLLSAILLSLAHLNYAIHFYIYTLTGEVFRQELIHLWPISILAPSCSRLFRCEKRSSSLNSNQRITNRTPDQTETRHS